MSETHATDHYERLAAALGAALGLIATAVAGAKESKAAAAIARSGDVLTVISAILETVQHGKIHGLDPDKALAEVKHLASALAADEAAADQALADKFDPG